MLKNLKRKEEGFTIIEVLIVLAIAALILVIVFLAVPALQRSSRNTQRKNDAANTLSAFSDYVSNNGGKLPSATCKGQGSGATNCAFLSNVKFGYFDPSATNVQYTDSIPSTAPTTEQLYIVSEANCSSGQLAAPQTGDSTRQYVAYYGIEGGNPRTGASNTTQCVEG